jgi:hypothetical protein
VDRITSFQYRVVRRDWCPVFSRDRAEVSWNAQNFVHCESLAVFHPAPCINMGDDGIFEPIQLDNDDCSKETLLDII